MRCLQQQHKQQRLNVNYIDYKQCEKKRISAQKNVCLSHILEYIWLQWDYCDVIINKYRKPKREKCKRRREKIKKNHIGSQLKKRHQIVVLTILVYIYI